MIESQNLYSRMRSEGSRFTLGGWGLRLCLPDVAQPSATAHNRPREVAMAVPLASFAKVVTFGGFKRRVASFRVAGVALCDIPTCFITQAQYTVASFSEDELHFSWQAQHFGFRGRRGIWRHVMKIDGSLARNIDFGVANFEVQRKTRRRKTSILWLHSVKGSLPRNASFEAPTCGLSCGLSVSIGKAAKPLLSKVSKQLHPLPEV